MEETTCRPEDFALDDNRLILRRMETSPGARREEGGPAGREPTQRTGRRGERAMRDARSRGAGSPGAADAAEETYKKWITMRRCAACGKAFATLPGYVYHLSVKGRMRW